MVKKKVVHIHSDIKFIYESNNFFCDNFENQILFLGDSMNYNGKHCNQIIYLKVTKKNIEKIIDLTNNADIVVLYNLDFLKSYIANRCSKDIKIIWRFFGQELYSKMNDFVYSPKTKKIISIKNTSFFKNRLIAILIFMRNAITYKTTYDLEFSKAAFKRVDCFLGLSEKEYLFLKQHWPRLPNFIQVHVEINNIKNNNLNDTGKKNKVVIGNNRSPFNNHIDIIEELKKIDLTNLELISFFNYGGNGHYASYIRNQAKDIPQLQLIEKMLTLDEFNTIQERVCALVINGYRQMAMGNIFIALRNGIKVYLNIKNIMYHWLKDEGFVVFTTEDFLNDIKSNNTLLSKEDSVYNVNKIYEFEQNNNKDKFCEKIYLM